VVPHKPLRPIVHSPRESMRSLGNTGDQSTLKQICCKRSRSLSPFWNPVRAMARIDQKDILPMKLGLVIFSVFSTIFYIPLSHHILCLLLRKFNRYEIDIITTIILIFRKLQNHVLTYSRFIINYKTCHQTRELLCTIFFAIVTIFC